MQPIYQSDNTRFAYQLRFHLGFQTKHGQDFFDTPFKCQVIQDKLQEVCEFNDFHLFESKVQTDRISFLVSLKPSHSPARVVQAIKGNTSRLWNLEFSDRLQWSRGYFFRSVGDATVPAVLEYIAQQKTHHSGTASLLASFCNPELMALMEDRKYTHSVGQYVIHLVMSSRFHLPVLDQEIARKMLDQMLKTSIDVDSAIMRLEILDDHLHQMIQLPPHCAPESIALAMMNNTEALLRSQFPGWYQDWGLSKVWSNSAYLGTVGAVSSKRISRYLRKE